MGSFAAIIVISLFGSQRSAIIFPGSENASIEATSAAAAEGPKLRQSSILPAAPTVDRNRTQRESFNSSDDLWKLANDALKRSDSPGVYEGFVAAKECNGVVQMQDEFANFASGGNSLLAGALTPERQLGIQRLFRLCEGFIKAGKTESRQLMKALGEYAAQLTQIAPSQRPDIRNRPAEWAAATKAVFSNSLTAAEEAIPTLIGYRTQSLGTPQGEREQVLVAFGGFLAMCDMGKDCSSQGYSASLSCAMSGSCGDLWDHWENDFSESERLAIGKYRATWREAIERQDLTLLDMHP